MSPRTTAVTAMIAPQAIDGTHPGPSAVAGGEITEAQFREWIAQRCG